MNILVVGSGSAALQTFKIVVKTGHRVTAVLSSPAPYEFKGANLVTMAEKLSVPVWAVTLVKDPYFADTMRKCQVDLLLNINSLYRICPEVLEAPKIGAFNFHPSMLPRYAGLNAPSWALFHGEQSHGVTIHWMVPKIDAGAIAYQVAFPIDPGDTCGSVSFKCAKYGVQLLESLLHAATVNPETIPRTSQDLTERQYFSAGPPYQGRVQWNLPANAIRNFLRACEYRPFPSPWGHPQMRLNGTEIGIVAGQSTGRAATQLPGMVGEVSDAGAMVACADEWLLVTEIFADGCYLPATKLFHSGMCLGEVGGADSAGGF